jgi:thiol-disulfide isomerase/thioredoxin
MLRFSVALVLLIAGCASTSKTVLSMRDITCASCGSSAVEALDGTPGVKAARFDRPRAELTIEYDAETIQPPALIELVTKASGSKVVMGAGKGTYIKNESVWPQDADMQIIDDPAVPLTPVAGKVTVFDYYADWCGPCREVDVALRKYVEAGGPIAVRKVNIGDWGKPMANTHMKGIAELPHVRIHGPDGAVLDTFSGLDLARLNAVLTKAAPIATAHATP